MPDMARPNRNRQRVSYNLDPATVRALQRIAAEERAYQGDLIDRAVQKVWPDQIAHACRSIEPKGE